MPQYSCLFQTILNPKSCSSAVKYSLHPDHLDGRHCNSADPSSNQPGSNASLCSTTGRRRKGSSLGGTLSSRSNRNESKELRSALQDREAVIQNLRIQLCLGKLPRPSGPPLDESEKPAAQQKLQQLTAEAENKKIKIRNIKCALEKLDITDNIDVRIRQAELEYALGREELQMLSIVEEARELQARLEKSKSEAQTLYSIITSGCTLSLHAVQATTGRWAAHTKPDQTGFFVEWALDGDGLYKGDRILEVNGRIVSCKTKEELQKIIGNSGKCKVVVLRKKSMPIPQKQLDQEKENNMRLQHRISYLEEQVRELQSVKEQQQNHHKQQQSASRHSPSISGHNCPTTASGHVTSISISSPPSTPPEKPLVFQRGNYITTLVGGKPIELSGETQTQPISRSNSSAHITKTMIKENSANVLNDRPTRANMPSKSLSASKTSINSDSMFMHHYRREKERHRNERDLNGVRERERYERSSAAVAKANSLHQRGSLHAKSVEHLNHCNGLDRHRDGQSYRFAAVNSSQTHRLRANQDMRSVKSLDFDSESESKPSDTVSEVRSGRPTPPKKPLRLSLQRAQSLQTVELNPSYDVERKRALKRAHINAKSMAAAENAADGVYGGILIENFSPLHTSSLGRQKINL